MVWQLHTYCIQSFIVSRHAKRMTVSMEDVKLCCRWTPSLLEFIAGQADKLKAEKEAGKEGGGVVVESSTGGASVGGKKAKGGRKRTAVVIDDDWIGCAHFNPYYSARDMLSFILLIFVCIRDGGLNVSRLWQNFHPMCCSQLFVWVPR